MNSYDCNIWCYVTSFSKEVTGSNTHVTINWKDGRKVSFAIDCGLFQETACCELNSEGFGYNVSDVDFAIATHAHTDHIGRFPFFVKEGFGGKIYMSRETAILFPEMLKDTATNLKKEYLSNIARWKEERNARKKNKIGKRDKKRCAKSKHKFTSKEIEHDKPCLIFENKDIRAAQKQISVKNMCETFYPCEDVEVTFYPNGHMLGAVVTVIKAKYKDEQLVFLATGDISNANKVSDVKLSVPKDVLNQVNFVLSESTYGASIVPESLHDEYKRNVAILSDAIKNGKTVIYLVNAIERPEVVMKELKRISETEDIGLDKVPIYFDSTFGQTGLGIYKNLLGTEYIPNNLQLIDKTTRVQAMNKSGAKVFLLTSPRLYQGTVRFYAKRFFEDTKAVVIFSSYIPDNIAGLMSMPKGTKLMYCGEKIQLNCTFCQLKHFSSHANKDELLGFVDSCQNANTILYFHGSNQAKANMVNDTIIKGKVSYALQKGSTVRLNRFGITKIY